MGLGCVYSSGPLGPRGHARARVLTEEKGAGCSEEGRGQGGCEGEGGCKKRGILEDE